MMQIDLLLWDAPGAASGIAWPHGEVAVLPHDLAAASAALRQFAQESDAEFLLLWRAANALPDARVLATLIESGVDAAHAGLQRGLGRAWPDLNLVRQDWSMIDAPKNRASTNWRLSLDACLIRREAWLQSGGLDAAFATRAGAGLELGFRLLQLGALIEYRPELQAPLKSGSPGGASTREGFRRDFYLFLLRHYGVRWAQYVFARRAVSRLAPRAEIAAFRAAQSASTRVAAPRGAVMWFSRAPAFDVKAADVSVIIPTLGRYPFLPGALESLQRQSVRPREVIVVDQNLPEEREPQTYRGYEDLNLRVIYQDERGQSLARNGGMAAARGEWVLLFEDDAVGADNLIEAHLSALCDGRFDVSAGIVHEKSWDNPPPPGFDFLRVAQTFPTGNSLLRLEAARSLGGLDRNYDFGPATDMDFGTRLYLSGKRIVLNPHAVLLHFKAPMGGLRVHGARKYNTDSGLLAPFPPVTLSYYGLRFLGRKQRRERLLLGFATSKMPRELRRGGIAQKMRALGGFVATLAFLPLKAAQSRRQARALLARGPQTMSRRARVLARENGDDAP